MKSAAVLIILLATNAYACDKCHNYVNCCHPVVKVENKVDVQFRHLRFIHEKPKENPELELALQRQWELVTSAIPIPPPIDQRELFRPFRFRDNMPLYSAPQKVKDSGYQEVHYVRRQRVLRGMVDFSFKVEPGGHVNLIQPFQSQIEQQGDPYGQNEQATQQQDSALGY